MVGLRFRRTQIENGRVKTTDETFERRGPVVISSIGSIPDPIEGIEMKGELFNFMDWTYGRLAPYPTVFSVGNVVTGKGNIVASRKHASAVSQNAVEVFLGVSDDPDASAILEPEGAEVAERVVEQLRAEPATHGDVRQALLKRIAQRQAAVDYPGDFPAWIERVGDPC